MATLFRKKKDLKIKKVRIFGVLRTKLFLATLPPYVGLFVRFGQNKRIFYFATTPYGKKLERNHRKGDHVAMGSHG